MKKLFVLLTIWGGFSSLALPASESELKDDHLVGYNRKNPDLVTKVSDIVIGQFTYLGDAGFDSPGAVNMSDALVQIGCSLKGQMSGSIKVSYRVGHDPVNGERTPQLGTQYIFFISKREGAIGDIKKLIPATDDNISKVKALIAAAPASK